MAQDQKEKPFGFRIPPRKMGIFNKEYIIDSEEFSQQINNKRIPFKNKRR